MQSVKACLATCAAVINYHVPSLNAEVLLPTAPESFRLPVRHRVAAYPHLRRH
jgi:hypothetical protein